MNKRLSIIPICIVILALFLGGSTTGCGSSETFDSASADESANPPDQNPTGNPGNNEPGSPLIPYTSYYWVSTEGSDENPGTQDKPFRTLYKASLECYRAAKDIYIYPGTYVEEQAPFFPPNVSIYGLGSRTVDPVKFRPVIDIRDCGYDECYFGLIGSNSSYNSGSTVNIDGLKILANGTGIWAYHTTLTLTNSEIIVSGTDQAIGIDVHTADTVKSFSVSDSTITTEDLIGSNANAQGIAIFDGTCDNLAIDILDSKITVGRGDGQSVGLFIANFSDCEQNILVKGNSISSSESSGISAGAILAYSDEVRIEQNTITAGTVQDIAGTNQISVGVSLQSDSSHNRIDLTLLNNTIYGGSGGDDSYGVWLFDNIDAFILFNTIDGGTSATDEVTAIKSYNDVSTDAHNNILCAGTSNNSYGIFEIRGTSMELSHNLFCDDLGVFYETHADNALPQSYTDVATINALGADFASNVSGDPNFVNFADQDYHIVFPSDAVDEGRSVTGIAHDLDGNARVQGQAPDIGAYELR